MGNNRSANHFVFLVSFVTFFAVMGGCRRSLRENNFVPKKVGIIGGQEVNHQAPLALGTVWISSAYSETESQACTGTLIDTNIVLTAAHCVAENIETPQNVMIVFSAAPQADEEADTLLAKAVQSKKIFVHESYEPTNELIKSDIAMIELYHPAPSLMKPVQLATLEKSWSEYEEFLLLGYGRTSVGILPDAAPVVLRGIERRPLVGENLSKVREMVARVFKSDLEPSAAKIFLDLLFDSKPLAESIWVDQTDQKGMCVGDSGGPLFVLEDSVPKQVGVASIILHGELLTEACTVASSYTNVLKYADWIRHKMEIVKASNRQNADLDHREISTVPNPEAGEKH